MDARNGLLVVFLAVGFSLGAGHRTQNFVVQASTPQIAQAVGNEAERLRQALAVQWLGNELPAWPVPCPIRVYTGPRIPAHGATTYTPDRGIVRDFHMEIHGSPERVLDSVLPHEVTHTVLASHFGKPLPRWADEGASTTVEHETERGRHEEMLREFLTSRRGIAMNDLFRLRDYPDDMLPMYSQGYSVAQFLIAQGGHRKFVTFLEDYFRRQSWTQVMREHYGYESLAAFQNRWLAWVTSGSPPLNPNDSSIPGNANPSIMLVNNEPRTGQPSNRMAKLDRSMPALQSTASPTAQQGDDGWYARRREQVMAREAPGTVWR